MAKLSTFGFLGHYSVLKLQLINSQTQVKWVWLVWPRVLVCVYKAFWCSLVAPRPQEALPFHCHSGGCHQLAGFTGNSPRVARTVGDIFPLTTREVQRLTQLPPQEMPLT